VCFNLSLQTSLFGGNIAWHSKNLPVRLELFNR